MISIFTPVHQLHERFLPETYASILEQKQTDWEWVLVPQEFEVPESIAADPRVKVYPHPVASIATLKAFACSMCSGDIYVQLHADDLFVPDTLDRIEDAWQTGGRFIYSNYAMLVDGSKQAAFPFDMHIRKFYYHGVKLAEHIESPSVPQSLMGVGWAPRHVRAWDKNAYWETGGFDATLPAGHDHDLIMRTYVTVGAKAFRHIDECLYLLRIHPDRASEVMDEQTKVVSASSYHSHFTQVMRRWCDDTGLLSVEVGSPVATGDFKLAADARGGDYQCDLNERWPFDDNSVGMLRAWHIFEHLNDKVHTAKELYRVMAPGGYVEAEIPSTEGTGAFGAPGHVTYWNEQSFFFWTKKSYGDWLPEEDRVRFQHLWSQSHTPDHFKEERAECFTIHLLCLKPPYDQSPVGRIAI